MSYKLLIFCTIIVKNACAFLSLQQWRNSNHVLFPRNNRKVRNMVDKSASTVFKVGDQVRVVGDVFTSNVNLNGQMGKVVETWEKCDVDPTCCCAEHVDPNLAVTVEFEHCLLEGVPEVPFKYYFGVEELEALPVAFDGLSCKAFKLDKLGRKDN